MTPATTHRRSLLRDDTRRRPGTGRAVGQAPTLFDAPCCEPVARTGGDDAAALDATGETARAVGLVGSGDTLDRIVVGGWERLANRAPTPCLLCGETMEPRYAAHAIPIGGRCSRCGTTLS